VWAYERQRLTAAAAGGALVFLLALDLFSVEKQYWMFSPRASTLYGSDPAIAYLQRQQEPGRVISFAPPGTVDVRDVMLEGDGLMVHNIRQVLGYHGNELGRYQSLAGKSSTTNYDLRTILTPAFWRHENVRFLYTNIDTQTVRQITTQLSLPPFELVVGPVKNASGTTVYLYRLPGDNPAAWVAPIFVKASDTETRSTVLDPRFDPTRVAILDTNARIPAQQIRALPEPLKVPVRVTRYGPGQIQLQLASPPPAGAALLVSENYFPGWHATVDGKEAPVERTDYNLIGIQLPTAAKTVDLRFDDRAYETGKSVTLVAGLAAIALALWGLLAQRWRSPRPDGRDAQLASS
jgi:hypothetical protein